MFQRKGKAITCLYRNCSLHTHHACQIFSEVSSVSLISWPIMCMLLVCMKSCRTQDQILSSHKYLNLTFGFLSSFKYAGGMAKLIAGAIPIAVEDVNSREDLLPNHRLQFLVGDTGDPQTAVALRKMTEMRESGAVAFIGPDHSCDCEALAAAAWSVPMISFNCADPKVSNKKIYPTFARILPPSYKVSKSVVALLLHYNWRKIVLVVANNTSDLQVREVFTPLAKLNSIDITGTHYLPEDYISSYRIYLHEIIDKSFKTTRVYVLLADDYALADFARYMHGHNLLEKGEYVIILVEEEQFYKPKKHSQFIRRDFEASDNKKLDSEPFRSVLMITPAFPINSDFQIFQDKVLNYSSRPPFSIRYHELIKVEVPIHAGILYDAVMIYARAVTEVLAGNNSEKDGVSIFQHIKGRPYESILGFSVMIDENGDAEGNYSLLSLKQIGDGGMKSFQPVGGFTYQGEEDLPSVKLEKSIDWIAGHPPLHEPKCGFFNEHCVYKPDWKLILICTVCVIVLGVAVFFAVRHYRYEHKLACLLWKVDMKDVLILMPNSDYNLQGIKIAINFPGLKITNPNDFSGSLETDLQTGRTVGNVGVYKGNFVYIKPIYKRSVDLTRALRKEMIQIREMRQENVNPFIGACVDFPNMCILSLFCSRGSLQDILKNSDINLDAMFVASLVADLIKGMSYIHDSEMVYHGNLKSSNCLVDSRWVLQVTDFGLHEFKSNQELPHSEQMKYFNGLLWTAPELLRSTNPLPRGTQKGDVYSFGIILHEILSREGPWGTKRFPPECIIQRVINPQAHGMKIYRPSTLGLNSDTNVIRCMEECWDEDPDARPDFRLIGAKLKDMLSEVKTNIFDNMISIMEKYACNLEGLVQERTHLLLEEKKKTENLLLRMLPKSVAEQLKRGERVEAESFDCVTIYFSDIVGFTALSALSTPLQVVDLLNDLYTCFDSIIGHYDVYKVETIGDAYMVVSGLPIRNGDKHAAEIVSMALHLLKAIRSFEIPHRPGERLKLRIGIHSGPCVAGVVGLKMPRYCLFGDTVNTASRMESTGEALKIHVSSACKEIIDKMDNFELEERGMTQVKGKGVMRTYWLLRRRSPPEVKDNFPEAQSGDFSKPQEKHRLKTDNLIRNSPPSFGIPDSMSVSEIFCSSFRAKVDPLLSGDHANSIEDQIFNKKRFRTDTTGSCFTLFHECTKSRREIRRESRSLDLGCRSTPIISLKDFSSQESLL